MEIRSYGTRVATQRMHTACFLYLDRSGSSPSNGADCAWVTSSERTHKSAFGLSWRHRSTSSPDELFYCCSSSPDSRPICRQAIWAQQPGLPAQVKPQPVAKASVSPTPAPPSPIAGTSGPAIPDVNRDVPGMTTVKLYEALGWSALIDTEPFFTDRDKIARLIRSGESPSMIIARSADLMPQLEGRKAAKSSR